MDLKEQLGFNELKLHYKYVIFTDGACSGNPGHGGWAAILINLEKEKLLEIGGSHKSTTNNKMEILAVTQALKILPKKNQDKKKILLLTDSKYVIKGITQWIHSWKKENWKTKNGDSVKNQELWTELLNEVQLSLKIDFRYCPGHSGIVGNERADELAVNFRDLAELEEITRDQHKPDLFFNDYALYPYPILPIPRELLNAKIEENKKESHLESSKSAYYVSYVNGIFKTHNTWGECEAQVKGRTNAKFKKVKNTLEEAEVKKKWGV